MKLIWTYDEKSDTWLAGENQNNGSGVFRCNNGKWKGNVSYCGTMHFIDGAVYDGYDTKELAQEACEKQLALMRS